MSLRNLIQLLKIADLSLFCVSLDSSYSFIIRTSCIIKEF